MSASSLSGSKFLRVYPILGLMLYYLGGLIQSLDMPSSEIFLILLIGFSLVELIALGLKHRKLMLIGSIAIIIGSAGPITYFVQELLNLSFTMAFLGGAIVSLAIIFHILTFWVWFNKK